ncbi:unnamed protein product [Onchocerca flexuosa]|uniref:Uncharacterized protein n=1 Tax=Onchocerca flexuosa TaxID=387005 RepID=A0A183HB58_9BILA|nr:unnamed protein product [Onchocerca flexuosa]
MSMKFFAGLQDFLGLYDTSSSSTEQQQQEEQQLALSTSTTAPTSAAVVVTAGSSLLSPPLVSSVNSDPIKSEGNSLKYISDIINSHTTVQREHQQLLQKLTLDDSKEITNAEEKIQQCSHKRNVHFPDVIVTDFYDAPTNFFCNKSKQI